MVLTGFEFSWLDWIVTELAVILMQFDSSGLLGKIRLSEIRLLGYITLHEDNTEMCLMCIQFLSILMSKMRTILSDINVITFIKNSLSSLLTTTLTLLRFRRRRRFWIRYESDVPNLFRNISKQLPSCATIHCVSKASSKHVSEMLTL
jgi:hypothetical protein